MPPLGAAVEPLGVQDDVHLRRPRARFALARARPQKCEGVGVRAAAFEARPVPGGERCHLVEKEQTGKALAPHLTVPAPERQQTADPGARGPAPRGERAVVAVKAPATIAV